MLRAFVFIQAEPSRVQELVEELDGMKLASSEILDVYAVTGRWDLIALIESPDISSLGDWVANGIGNVVGVQHTETSLIIWSGEKINKQVIGKDDANQQAPVTPIFDADRMYDAGDQGCATGPLDEISSIIREISPGQTLEIHATDAAVSIDLGAWCRMTGNELVEQSGNHFLVRKK